MIATRERIIKAYIESYNHFDVDRMVKDVDEAILFENIVNGEVNLSIKGIAAFREQAEKAKHYFFERRQTILSITHCKDESVVAIDYQAILAMDLPNGLKKGEAFTVAGRSVFTFSGSRIVALQDIS